LKKTILAIIVVFLFHPLVLISQSKTTTCQQFKKLSRPEKCWVIKHIFVAKKAWKITQYVRLQTDSIQKTSMLDGDANGGKVDAFRHAFWMASLSQKMRWRKAYRLGKAHEKGNYLDYKKHRLEDGTFPDKVSSDMDLWNNNIGLQIGKANKGISSDSLKNIVIEYIHNGKMKIIKKNIQGQFINFEGNIIENDSLKGKWENQKVLVNSDL
jgi:hypothetical protein